MSRDEEKETKNQYTVVLKGLRSDFKVFGENLEGVREKGDATFEKVGQLSEDMQFVKGELRLIRNELKEKVGKDEFVALEDRVIALENMRRT